MDDGDISLARGALDVARLRYPDVVDEPWLERLDELASQVRAHEPAPGEAGRIALNEVLFAGAGLSGNQSDYYNERNSYLNEVLERRIGIPITLCIIYLEVAWRAGLEAEPVAFPGHFLVRLLDGSAQGVVVDPFNAGRSLSRSDLAAQLRSAFGIEAASRIDLDDAVAPVPRREVLARMVRNLVAIHDRSGDEVALLAVAHLGVSLVPEGAHERRTRGLAYWKIGHRLAARADLERYLALAPDAPDAGQVTALLERLDDDPLN